MTATSERRYCQGCRELRQCRPIVAADGTLAFCRDCRLSEAHRLELERLADWGTIGTLLAQAAVTCPHGLHVSDDCSACAAAEDAALAVEAPAPAAQPEARIITYKRTKAQPTTRRFLAEAFIRPGARMARSLTQPAEVEAAELEALAARLGYTILTLAEERRRTRARYAAIIAAQDAE